MTLRGTFTALLLCAAVSTTTIAAPPEGKGGGKKSDAPEFEPEILYQYNGRKSQDLRLTDNTGDPYVTVHSAAQAQLDGFTLSDETAALIAYSDYGDLYLTSWSKSPVEIGAKTLLSSRGSRGEEAGRIAWMQFSNDSKRLAFTESSGRPDNLTSFEARRLWVFDLSMPEPSLIISNFVVGDVHWSPVENEEDILYFSGGPIGPNRPSHIYRFDLATGELAPVLDYGTHFTSKWFDITGIHAQTSPRLAVAYNDDQTREFIRIYSLAGNRINENWVAPGDILTFDCTGTRLIHKDEGSTGSLLTITTVNQGATPFLAKRGTHSIADWMPKSSC